MTFNAQRDNIKRLRVIWVVVFLCLFATGALEGIYGREFTVSDSIAYDVVGLSFFGIVLVVFLTIFIMRCPAPLGLHVSFLNSYSFVAKTILSMANLTVARIACFLRAILVKFRNWFSFLAMVALFRYDGLKHDRFSLNGCVFKPSQTQYLCGFSYYQRNLGRCQGKI